MDSKKIYTSPEAVCILLTTEQSVLQASVSGYNEGFIDSPIEYILE